MYTTEDKVEDAALADWKRREPRWEEQGLRFKQSLHSCGGSAVPFTKWHYHSHEFTVDAEAAS